MRIRYLLILLLPLSLLLNHLSSQNALITERLYSSSFYRVLAGFLVNLTGEFPFSLAEALLLGLVAFVLWRVSVLGIKLLRETSRRRTLLTEAALNALALVSVLVFCLEVFWGLNYNRLPLAQLLGLEVRPAPVGELRSLCASLVIEANELRQQVGEDEKGVMTLKDGYRGVFDRVEDGYSSAGKIHKEFEGPAAAPKPILLSGLMSYTGLTGVYSPLTGEANVNTALPPPLLPFTACHEAAHQRGFAREDEANFAAYLACRQHPDPDFRYSGALEALTYSMSALYRRDPQVYAELRSRYHPGVQRDLEEIARFSRLHAGPLQRWTNRANDLYLKANRQPDGVGSYGRMVDLLLAERRVRH